MDAGPGQQKGSRVVLVDKKRESLRQLREFVCVFKRRD